MLAGVARNISYIRKLSNRHYLSIRLASYNGGTHEEPKTGGAGLRVVAAANGINRMMFMSYEVLQSVTRTWKRGGQVRPVWVQHM